MSFLDEFRAAMTNVSGKTVTRTDIAKASYIPDASQRSVMSAAGIEPVDHTDERIIAIRVAGSMEVLNTTYYASQRAGSGRNPEVRMGRDLVHWVSQGETLWLGTDGRTVFALKSTSPQIRTSDAEEIGEAIQRLGRLLDSRSVLERARLSAGPPGRRETRSTVFERNGWVKEFARRRSNGNCEMPDCKYVGFEKTDGTLYIEVHHINSLAEEGFDIIENVAAICPNCHARAHHAKNKAVLQTRLLVAIRAANARYLPTLA